MPPTQETAGAAVPTADASFPSTGPRPEPSLHRRALTIGAVAMLVAVLLALVGAEVATRRRLAAIEADLDRFAAVASWPHRAYLEPSLRLGAQLASMRANGPALDAGTAKRLVAASLAQHTELAVVAYRSTGRNRAWLVVRDDTPVDVEALERLLVGEDRARVAVLPVAVAPFGETLLVRFPVTGGAEGESVLELVRLDGLARATVGGVAGFRLQIVDGARVLLGTRETPPSDARVVTRPIDVAGQRWTARAWPAPEWLATERRSAWWGAASLGILAALGLAAALVWLLPRWWRMARGSRVAEERTRLIVDRALDAVVTLDPAGAVTGWNPRADATFGWRASEAVGRRLVDLVVAPAERDACSEQIARLAAGDETHAENRRVEVRALHRDGREFPVELSVSAFQLGGTVTVTAFLRDISERKRAELELRDAKDAAEAANRAKSEFLATMSHEIRTPMNGIFGMTELALDTDDEAERRDFLLRARACAESLMTIINDVLDFSKVEAGKLDLEHIDFELASVLDGVLDTLAIEAGHKGLELVGQIAPALPTRLRGDPGRLRQVVMNLAGNALKFTDTGEIVITFDAASDEAGADGTVMLACAVRDTGIGIPRDKQQTIFESFTQADSSTTRRYGGTGLGLAISQRLVGLMGGRIGVESTPGSGSTFWFQVPLAPAESGAGARDAKRLHDLCVVVADANASSRALLATTLAAAGAVVEVAQDAAEACAAIGTRCDALVLDVRIERASGGASFMTADGARVPVVVLTPIGDDATGIPGALVLPKPIKQERLVEAVERVIRAGVDGVAAPAASAAARPARILVVDDNEANRVVADTMLRRAGYVVRLAADGREALAAVAAWTPDLVLMDLQMPDLDGVAAVRMLRATESPARRIPVIAVTATSSSADRRRCEEAGMIGYLLKPLRREDLLTTVATVLAGVERPATEPVAEPASDDPDGERAFMAEITARFLEDAIERCRALRDAVRDGEAATVQRIGHHIKGGAAQLEIHGVRELAAAVEVLGRDGQVEPVEALLPLLEREIEGVRQQAETSGAAHLRA